MFFMHPKMTPKNKNITCVKLVFTIRPLKEEVNRVRDVVGGDVLEHNRFTRTASEALSTVKIHLNSTISTPDARNFTADVKYFYCGTPIMHPNNYEHAQIPLNLVPIEIIKQCGLLKTSANERVYF